MVYCEDCKFCQPVFEGIDGSFGTAAYSYNNATCSHPDQMYPSTLGVHRGGRGWLCSGVRHGECKGEWFVEK